jgi:hypothetical protein
MLRPEIAKEALMRSIRIMIGAAMLLWATAAVADPFEGSELLVGRCVKQPASAKLISFGVNVQFAPVQMLLASQKDEIVSAGIDAACEDAPDPAACRQAAQANADTAMTALATVSDDQWSTLEAAANDPAKLDAALAQAGVPEDQRQDVVAYVDQVPADKRKDALGVAKLLGSQDVTSVMVEPNLEVNFKLLALSLKVPFAVMMLEDRDKWNLGNITLDAKFGHIFGSNLAAFGLSYGLSAYLPTGTNEANALGLSDLFYGPKFFHEYLTFAPYVALGFDLPGFSLQGHGELVSQHAVRGDPEFSNVLYGKYGVGFILLPNFPLSVIAEANGLAPISNAAPYSALFGVGGVQLKLIWLKASVAVQVPLVQPEKEEMSGLGGVDVGELASYSIIGRAAFSF